MFSVYPRLKTLPPIYIRTKTDFCCQKNVTYWYFAKEPVVFYLHAVLKWIYNSDFTALWSCTRGTV